MIKFTAKSVNYVCWHHFCKFLNDAVERDENNTPLFICKLQKEFDTKIPYGQNGCTYKRTDLRKSMELVFKMRKEKVN